MASQDYVVPDLASVLRTLAALAPRGQQAQANPSQVVHPSAASISPPALRNPLLLEMGSAIPGPKLIDPATIIDWSAGLRCVMKTVAAHDNIIKEIKRMMKTQHEHEQQWWNGRHALLQRQKARKEGQKKLDEILRAVGGAITARTEDLEEEVKTFDMKVHRAQVQMVKEMNAKLKSFGVPFFGTRSELVRKSGESAGETKTVDVTELLRLQRRMIDFLEDLCREE